jgi:signal peptidase II
VGFRPRLASKPLRLNWDCFRTPGYNPRPELQSTLMDHPATDHRQDPPAKPPSNTAGRRPAAITLFVLVALAALATDLGLKSYAFKNVAGAPVVLDASDAHSFGVPYHEPIVLIPGVLNLQLTANAGAIFGMGKGSRWVFITVSVIAVGFVCRVFWRSAASAPAFHTALALILAGALGNLYDRVRFAAVRDMLHLFPGVDLPFGLSWPGDARGLYPWIFNLADVALLLGVLTVVWVTWKHAPPPPASQTSQD